MAQTRPDFSGIWQLNVAKSVILGQIPLQTLMKIEHAEPKLIQRVLILHNDGRENIFAFDYETGADTTTDLGAGKARSRAHWQGAELMIESWLKSKDRELHFKDYWALSSDGNTLTMAHRDDDLAGQISVFERAAAEAAAKFKGPQ